MKKTLLLIAALTSGAAALAKLPPPSEEAQAKAAEAAAKTAHGNKVADFQLCKSREKVAAHYYKTTGKGKPASKEATPACTDPGPFKYEAQAAAAPAAAPAPAAPAAKPANKG